MIIPVMTPRPRSRLSAWPGMLALLMTVLLIGVLAPTPVRAGPGSRTLIDFDNPPLGTPVFNQFDGVTFTGGDSSDHPIFIGEPVEGTASGVQALVANTTVVCEREFHCRNLHVIFDEPQSLVQLSVGSKATGGNVTVHVTGLDASGTSVTQTQADSLCSATTSTPVTTPLTLTDSLASIVAVDVTYVACTGPNAGQPLFAVAGVPIEIDDLAFTLPLSPPPREHDPPIFTNISPADGTAVKGSYPELISWTVSVEMQEAALERLTVQINSGPEREMSFSRTGPLSYAGGTGLKDTDGLKAGLNTLTLKATDFDLPQNTTMSITSFTFTPAPKPPPSDDIRLGGFEVTQALDPGLQSLCCATPVTTSPWDGYDVDYHPSIPLLQGKQTLVRVYADYNQSGAVDNVPAVASIRKAGCSSACDLAVGMPPVAIDPTSRSRTANLNGITVQQLGKVGVAAEEADLTKTWDFVIPPGYTNQDLDVTIRINDGRYVGFPQATSVSECTSDSGWYCQHNNLLVLHVHFQPTPTITVTLVLVRAGGSYTCSVSGPNNGKTLSPTDPGAPPEARLPSFAQINEVFRILNVLYPMHVEEGALSYLDIDVATADKDNLIAAIRDRASDDGEFILGLLPVDPRCPHNYGPNALLSDGTSITAGYGGVGHNGAWADADNPMDAAHELGHNIGFDHWGCENFPVKPVPGLGIDDECGVFPIAHAGIGAYGTDIDQGRVLPPGDNSSNATPHAHDFMSYGQLCSVQDASGTYIYGGAKGCDMGEWVSWYTYSILYGNTSIGDYDTNDPPALSISGLISQSGAVTFEPVYAVTVNHALTDLVNEDDTEQLYTLEGYDAKGNVVLVHNFEPVKQQAHEPHASRTLYFREAVPVVPNLARIDLLRGTTVVGSLANPVPGELPTVAIASPSAGARWSAGSQQTIRWTSSSPTHLPLYALVQYSPDGGATQITLARNVKGSALVINTDELPGSPKGTISVEVSDGMNTATAQVGPITVQLEPPQVVIASPAPGLRYAAPIPVTYTAMAFDLQSSTKGLKYRWSADNGKFTFAERSGMLTLQNALPPGEHTVSVEVTAPDGQTGTASVSVTILTPEGKLPGGFDQALVWPIGIIAALGLAVALLLYFLATRQQKKKAA